MVQGHHAARTALQSESHTTWRDAASCLAALVIAGFARPRLDTARVGYPTRIDEVDLPAISRSFPSAAHRTALRWRADRRAPSSRR